MNRPVKWFAVFLLMLWLGLNHPQKSFAVFATEPTQLLNNIQLVISVAKQTQMVLNQVEMIQNQLKSLEKYPQGQWGDVMNVIHQLESVIEQGQAISYTLENIAEIFKQKYPGYSLPQDYAKAYQDWSGTTLDTIRNSLVAAGWQRKNFESESSTLKAINSMSDQAAGEMQAIQAGNQIANQTATQIMLLRKLTMDQLNAQVAYMSYQVNKDAADQAVADHFFKEIPYVKGQSPAY